MSSMASCAAVAGCAVVVIGMAHSGGETTTGAKRTARPSPTSTSHPAFVPAPVDATGAPSDAAPATASSPPSTPTAAGPSAGQGPGTPVERNAVPPPRSGEPAVPAAIAAVPTAPAQVQVARRAAPPPMPAPVRPGTAGSSLPLPYSTGNATRVITVTASSHSSTTATLQAWTRVSGAGWVRYGSSVTAHVGADGIGSASETRSATPSGSFTLTQAFGRESDPGTGLPYFQTNLSDYWISTKGTLYNTHQRCSSCGYDNGTNERLYAAGYVYNYAVVIDYNTRNAPGGVQPGAGSAFFLHVTDGNSTAGCVSIPQTKLVSIMRWLTPSAHPRILIGVV